MMVDATNVRIATKDGTINSRFIQSPALNSPRGVCPAKTLKLHMIPTTGVVFAGYGRRAFSGSISRPLNTPAAFSTSPNLIFRTRKTGAFVTIQITGDLAALIDRLLAWRGTKVDVSPYLLRDEQGYPLTRGKLRSRFDKARELAGIDKAKFQFRDLRARRHAQDDRRRAGSRAAPGRTQRTRDDGALRARHAARETVALTRIGNVRGSWKREGATQTSRNPLSDMVWLQERKIHETITIQGSPQPQHQLMPPEVPPAPICCYS
ncbi:hypothetical protein [Burkholderia sp. LMG 21824]|uniref:hypothetical protein n=1 Tax=Burkholderia sp. LMG 21824 TaxID=3158172 RepID=UPI003C2B9F2E